MATAAESHVTTDHKTIRAWAEERGGVPATVTGTDGAVSEPGVLRIDFPGFGEDEKMESLSWDEFFKKFEEKKLAFLYQERTKEGDVSRFNKFVRREREGAR